MVDGTSAITLSMQDLRDITRYAAANAEQVLAIYESAYPADPRRRATPAVVAVLKRYPAAAPGGGRVGELLRELDAALHRYV